MYNVIHYSSISYNIILVLFLLGGALDALKFQCAQRDSLSELFLSEKMCCNQCKGKCLRDSAKL